MTPVIIVRLLQTTFSDILWPLEIKQTDRCHRDREEELDRQADRTDGGLVSNTVWFGDQPTRGKLSNTGRKLLINLSSDGEKTPERAEREWERENEGQERKRGIQQNMTRCEKGEWQRANYPLLCSRYFFNDFYRIDSVVPLIQHSCQYSGLNINWTEQNDWGADWKWNIKRQGRRDRKAVMKRRRL